MSSFDNLPDNVVLEVFCKSCSKSLQAWEVVCRRFRKLIVQQQLWRQRCAQFQLAGVDLASIKVSCEEIKAVLKIQSEDLYVSSLLFKKLFQTLQIKPDEEIQDLSLVLDGLHATSTDHEHENVRNTITKNLFRPVQNQLSAYWSSTGSSDPKITDTLTYCLAHPLCIIRQVEIRPFRAFFQRGAPIYAPSLLRMRVCNSKTYEFFNQDGVVQENHEMESRLEDLHREACGAQINSQQNYQLNDQLYTTNSALQETTQLNSSHFSVSENSQNFVESEVFSAKKQDSLQKFILSKPIVCIGGTVQIDLIGRTQIQEGIDDLYYNCVAVARFVGQPIYNFRICRENNRGDQILRYWQNDSLIERGGLESLEANLDYEEEENMQFPLLIINNWQQENAALVEQDDVQEMQQHP